jgi:hypothetical protein
VVRIPVLLVAGATMAVSAAGCGTQTSRIGVPPATSPVAGVTAPVSPGSVVLGSASNAAGWTAVVTSGPGDQLQLTVTVSGPLTVLGGCEPSLTAWAVTPAGAAVPTPTPVPGAHCMAIVLVAIPAGTTRSFSASLPDPPQAGTYVIEGTLRAEGSPAMAVPAVTVAT